MSHRVFLIVKSLGVTLLSVLVWFGCLNLTFNAQAQPATARIDFPLPESVHKGVIEIRGEASTPVGFGGGLLELVKAGQTARNLLTLTAPVDDGVLYPEFDTRDWEDGIYLLKLSVFDANGIPAFAETTFVIANAPPSDTSAPKLIKPVRINHLLYGNHVLPRSASVGVYGMVNEPMEVTDARWLNGNGSYIVSVPAKNVTFNDLELNAFLAVPGGGHASARFEFRGEDQAGNVSEWFSSNLVVLTDQAPSPFLRPSTGAMLLPNDGNRIQFEGLLWDAHGVFDRLEWRRALDAATWTPVTDVSPVWQGFQWGFDWQVTSVLSAEVEVQAWDRFGNRFGPARTQIRLASHPIINIQFPIADLIIPSGVVYQEPSSVDLLGTVQNHPDQEDYSWSLDIATGNSDSWLPIASDQSSEITNSILSAWDVPAQAGLYRIRLKASNSYGEVEIIRPVFVNASRVPDNDADGWSDRVEYSLFGILSETLDTDFDGDGMLNGEEILLGFDPADGVSRLRGVQLTEDDQLMLNWVNQSAIGYEVYRRERLDDGEWVKIEDIEASDQPLQSFMVPLDDQVQSRFYKIEKIQDPLASFQTLDLGNGITMSFAKIPAGTFTMGSPDSDEGRDSDEGPLTEVTISKDYMLGKHEVTQAQWRRLMGDNPSRKKGDHLPVENVSWVSAFAFCEQLTEREREAGRMSEDYAFTLPTEAQWEYACRAESQTRFYYGDDPDLESFHLYANYCDQECTFDWRDTSNTDGYANTAPVGSFLPNAWGLYDMHGNVWEWCLDRYSSNYPGGSVTDPLVEEGKESRVVRGGSWRDPAGSCRVARRVQGGPTSSSNRLGFRVAVIAVPEDEDVEEE